METNGQIGLLHLFFNKDQADAVRTERIAKWLYDAGKKPIIITFRNSKIRKSKYYSIYFLKTPPNPKLLSPFLLNVEILYLIVKLKIKILYLFLVGAATASLFVKKIFGSKIALIYDLQGVTVEEVNNIWQKSPFLIPLIEILFGTVETIILNSADYISFHNSILKTYYSMKYKRPFSNSIIIPNLPIFTAVKEPSKYENQLRTFIGDRISIAYIGRDQKWQGLEPVLDALKNYKNPKICFLFIGFNINKYGEFDLSFIFNKENIPKEEINNLLPVFDCGLIPRMPDIITMVAAPTKFFEYLGEGLIILGTDVGEAGQMIKKHKLGYTLDISNFEDSFNRVSNLTKKEISDFKSKNKRFYESFSDETKIIANLKSILKEKA